MFDASSITNLKKLVDLAKSKRVNLKIFNVGDLRFVERLNELICDKQHLNLEAGVSYFFDFEQDSSESNRDLVVLEIIKEHSLEISNMIFVLSESVAVGDIATQNGTIVLSKNSVQRRTIHCQNGFDDLAFDKARKTLFPEVVAQRKVKLKKITVPSIYKTG